LTVRAHDAGSHAGKGWERFTGKVIEVVAKVRTRGVVFLVWGTPAAKRVTKVDKKVHCVLQSVHPSPLSAMRGFVSRLYLYPSLFPPTQERRLVRWDISR
jgi:uracil-DNA glycosylase